MGYSERGPPLFHIAAEDVRNVSIVLTAQTQLHSHGTSNLSPLVEVQLAKIIWWMLLRLQDQDRLNEFDTALAVQDGFFRDLSNQLSMESLKEGRCLSTTSRCN